MVIFSSGLYKKQMLYSADSYLKYTNHVLDTFPKQILRVFIRSV